MARPTPFLPLTVLVAIGISLSSAIASESGLFRDTRRVQSEPIEKRSPETYVRSRLAEMNEKDFLRLVELYSKRKAGTLRLNIFDDVTLLAYRINRFRANVVGRESWYYIGEIDGGGEFHVVLGDPYFHIYLDTPSGSYVARQIERGLFLIAEKTPFDRSIPDEEFDPSDLPPHPQDMIDSYRGSPRE